MSKRHFAADVLAFGVAGFLGKCVAVLVVPLLTRSFTVDEYGAFDLLIAGSGLVAVVCSMSFESYLARSWGMLDLRGQKSKAFSSLLSIVIAVGIILAAIFFFGSVKISVLILGTASQKWPVFWVLASGVVIAISSLPLMVLRMTRRIQQFLFINLIQHGSYITIIVYCSAYKELNFSTASAAFLTSQLLGLLMALFFSRDYIRITVDSSVLWPAFRYSLPLLPAVGASALNQQVDRYSLLYHHDAALVGRFAVVTKVAALISVAVMVFRQAWLPYSYALARRDDCGASIFARVLTAYYILGLATCSVILLSSTSLMEILAPSEYKIDPTILPVILLASLTYGSASIVNVGTMTSGKTEWNTYAALIGLAINIVLTMTLVPYFGIAGAAWGTLVASIVFVGVLGWRSRIDASIIFPLGLQGAMSMIYLLVAVVWL